MSITNRIQEIIEEKNLKSAFAKEIGIQRSSWHTFLVEINRWSFSKNQEQ